MKNNVVSHRVLESGRVFRHFVLIQKTKTNYDYPKAFYKNKEAKLTSPKLGMFLRNDCKDSPFHSVHP